MDKITKYKILKKMRYHFKRNQDKPKFYKELSKRQGWDLSDRTISRYLKILKEEPKTIKKPTKIRQNTNKNTSEITPESDIDKSLSQNQRTKKEERINEFIALFQLGHFKTIDFLDYATSQGWVLSKRQIERYIQEAKKKYQESLILISKKDMKNFLQDEIFGVIKRSRQNGNDKLLLQAVKDLSNMHNLQDVNILEEETKTRTTTQHTKSLEEIERLLDSI